ncbi:hypothetical protein [Methylobacterium sp. C1]|uniref:hypothetical protein n=1 Tax=Methylobacterium sp. C1 TaxID=1479019 RepID=UPI0008DA1447|nr:hypothetical protein [Methylobacterium sp. C1]
MGADLTAVLGTDRAVHTHDEACRVIEVALERHGGPCPRAYADVLSAFVAATDHGRANLFLEMAYRAVGGEPQPAASAPARFRPDLTEWMGRAYARPPRRPAEARR